jgi:hypothetical protein
MADYEVFIESMDAQQIVGQLPYETLEITLRFNDIGRGRLTIPASLVQFDLFDNLYRLRIRRNGSNLLSGPVTDITRDWDGQDDLITIGITDDLYLLETRLIVPVPSGPPYTSADHDVRTGAIETVMHQYVYYHAGAGAKAERRIPGLTQAADQGRGGTVTARGRFTPLLSMLQNLAVLGGFGIRVVGLQFQVYQPVDKTNEVVYSREMNNLLRFSRNVQKPGGNYVYVGGGGEGTSRVIVEGGSNTSITRWGRIEAWRDQRNTSDTGELNQAITRYLIEQNDKEQQIQFSALASLDQVGLGDIVSIVFDGVTYTETVRQILIKTDGVSEEITISSGTNKPEIYQRMDDAEDSLMLMEVR